MQAYVKDCELQACFAVHGLEVSEGFAVKLVPDKMTCLSETGGFARVDDVWEEVGIDFHANLGRECKE